MSKILIGLTMLVGLLSGYIASISQGPTLGSVVQGNEYFATSTRNYEGTELANLTRLKGLGDSCISGSLGQVTITGAGAGVLYFWDATTTNSSLRTPGQASTTILIATIPASAAAGTYTFDAEFGCGLIFEEVGTAPTSTVMWR